MYRMIAIDIDDTLLNEKNEIAPATKTALQAAVDAGVYVTLATGRMFASARQIAGKLELNVPIITYQGAWVKNLLDGKLLYERSVPAEDARRIYDFAAERNLHLQLYHDDILYSRADNEKIRSYANLSKVPYKVEPDYGKLILLPLTKMLIIDEPDKLDRLMPEIQARLGPDVHMTKSKPNFLEFMHREGTKGKALLHLARHEGIPREAIIAVGDSWNDMDMLQEAGLGVAMDNAVPELKKAADYVTRSNKQDGVAHVINKFILGSGE